MAQTRAQHEFAEFVAGVEPRLRRAFVGWCGVESARDATAEALAWAWENWGSVQTMTNPVGYLYRVGQTRSRPRKAGMLPAKPDGAIPLIEPGLQRALAHLPQQQLTAVWLVHACEWSYAECAEAMEISRSAVGTHVARGLSSLRDALEVPHA